MVTSLVVIGIYLCILMIMGAVFGRINKNTSDYFRGGQRGTWWLVGMSMLVAGVSAMTFTGNAGVAYEAGFSFMVIYSVALVAFPIEYFYLAPRFRRLRLTTTAEVIRERYGALTEQFAAYLRLITSLFISSSFLWGLAIFVGTVFGYDVNTLIIVLGVVVIVYSATGGSWAVMGTDFVQGLVMFSMCLLLAVLSFVKLGGFGGMFELIQSAGISKEFALVKPDGAFSEFNGKYTLAWAITILMGGLLWSMSMGTAEKYFSVKDEKAAKRLSLMVNGTAAFTGFMFMLPNIVSRLFYSEQVDQLGLTKAAEGSYAAASLQLLPESLIGMIVIAMFAASMSSLDTGMNRNAALVIKNLMPPFYRMLGKDQPSEIILLWLGKGLSVLFGVIIIIISLYLANIEGKGMFDILMDANAILTPPLVVPMVFGLFLKRSPKYAAIVAIIAGALTGGYSIYLEHTSTPWTWVVKTWWIMGITTLAYLASLPFAFMNSAAYNQQVDGFFKKMATPIDFDKEVGEPNDGFQMLIMGIFSTIIGVFVLLLMLLPGNDTRALLCIGSVAGMILVVGLPLLWLGLRRRKAHQIVAANAEVGCAPSSY